MENHFNRIRMADSILVANFEKNGVNGYIGSNTLMEIGFATALGKRIYILNQLGNQGCSEELAALGVEILDGDLTKIMKG